jgi:hypothetical protein
MCGGTVRDAIRSKSRTCYPDQHKTKVKKSTERKAQDSKTRPRTRAGEEDLHASSPSATRRYDLNCARSRGSSAHRCCQMSAVVRLTISRRRRRRRQSVACVRRSSCQPHNLLFSPQVTPRSRWELQSAGAGHPRPFSSTWSRRSPPAGPVRGRQRPAPEAVAADRPHQRPLRPLLNRLRPVPERRAGVQGPCGLSPGPGEVGVLKACFLPPVE